MTDNNLELLDNVLKFTFEYNIKFLKEQFPHLHQKFKDYQPKNFKIALDDEKRINIIGSDGNYIYSQDPKLVSKAQAEKFFVNPLKSIYRLNPIDPSTQPFDYIHVNYLSKLAKIGKQYEDESMSKPYEPLKRYPLLSVIGVGLGYHLEDVAEQNIDHLYIYEPNEDLFYASLFIVDYKRLVEKFTQENRTITLVVGISVDKYIDGFQILLHKFGQHNSSCMPVYKHYDNVVADEGLKSFIKGLNYFYGGFGFFEDEVVSLRHTYKNIAAKRKFLLENKSFDEKDKMPVFICGSGPSLDDAIEVIKKYQDKALVISCGTSVMPLHRNGIVPDYHIEVERTDHVDGVLRALDSPELLKQTTLIGMNTLYDKVVEQFGDAILFLKPNDGGTDLVRVTYKHGLEQVFATNPTVTNGAVGVFNSLKSGDLYLFGCDYGYKDPENHHSKQTGYYKTYKEKKVTAGVDKSTKIIRKGNFGGEVFTNHVFDWARNSVEYSIRHHIDESENKTVFNCSDGLEISGTQPLRCEDINLDNSEVLDKAKIKQTLLSFASDKNLPPDVWQDSIHTRGLEVIKLIDEITDPRFMNVEIAPEQYLDIAQRAFYLMMQREGGKEIFAIRMMKGSLTYVFATTIGYVYMIGNDELRRKYINEAMPLIYDYFKGLKEIFIREFMPEYQPNEEGDKA